LRTLILKAKSSISILLWKWR